MKLIFNVRTPPRTCVRVECTFWTFGTVRSCQTDKLEEKEVVFCSKFFVFFLFQSDKNVSKKIFVVSNHYFAMYNVQYKGNVIKIHKKKTAILDTFFGSIILVYSDRLQAHSRLFPPCEDSDIEISRTEQEVNK